MQKLMGKVMGGGGMPGMGGGMPGMGGMGGSMGGGFGGDDDMREYSVYYLFLLALYSL